MQKKAVLRIFSLLFVVNLVGQSVHNLTSTNQVETSIGASTSISIQQAGFFDWLIGERVENRNTCNTPGIRAMLVYRDHWLFGEYGYHHESCN
jgi:hypothetical protein